MSQFNSRIARKIFIGCLLAVMAILVGLFSEVIGSDFSQWLANRNINAPTIYIVLIILVIVTIIYAALGAWDDNTNNNNDDKNSPTFPIAIQITNQNLLNSVKEHSEEKLGEEIEVDYELGKASAEEQTGIYDNDGFVRNMQFENVKIYPSEKIYARLNLSEDDWKREFTVRYPIIEGIKSESVLHKINSAINYEKVFEVSIADSIESDTWLTDLDYSIKLLKEPFLIIELHMEGIAAYSWEASKIVVVNYNNGNVIKINDILKENSFERLASIINEFVENDLEKSLLYEKYQDVIPYETNSKSRDHISDNSWLNEMFNGQKFTISDFDEFYFDEYTITFCYNFKFPRLLKGIEPEGRYTFDFFSLKQFLKKETDLDKFIEAHDYTKEII